MRYAGYIIALLLILTGCSDRLETDLTVAGLETSVRLDISVKPMQSTAPSTKAGYIDPSTQESTQIRDLWVLQFDGTDGSAITLRTTSTSIESGTPGRRTVTISLVSASPRRWSLT